MQTVSDFRKVNSEANSNRPLAMDVIAKLLLYIFFFLISDRGICGQAFSYNPSSHWLKVPGGQVSLSHHQGRAE